MEAHVEDSSNLATMPPADGNSETSRLVSSNSAPKPSYLNVVSNVCALIILGIISYCCFKDGVSLFSFHPTLMTLGVSYNFYYFIAFCIRNNSNF